MDTSVESTPKVSHEDGAVSLVVLVGLQVILDVLGSSHSRVGLPGSVVVVWDHTVVGKELVELILEQLLEDFLNGVEVVDGAEGVELEVRFVLLL